MEKRFITKITEYDVHVTKSHTFAFEYPYDTKIIPTCTGDNIGLLDAHTYWLNWSKKHLPNGTYRLVSSLTRSPWLVSSVIEVTNDNISK